MAVALAACSPTPSPPRCEQSIEGVWRSDVAVDGEVVGYHFLDRGQAVEGYPTFRDVPADLPPGVQAAPAAIDLVRAKGELQGGRWSRRYELGASRCVVAVPVHVTACAGDTLTLELGSLHAPTDWTACPAPADATALARAPIAAPFELRLHR